MPGDSRCETCRTSELRFAQINARLDGLYELRAELEEIRDRIAECKGAVAVHRVQISALQRETKEPEPCQTNPDPTTAAIAPDSVPTTCAAPKAPSSVQSATSAQDAAAAPRTATDSPAQIALLLWALRATRRAYVKNPCGYSALFKAVDALLASHPEAAWEELQGERAAWEDACSFRVFERNRAERERDEARRIASDGAAEMRSMTYSYREAHREKQSAEAALATVREELRGERALVDRMRGYIDWSLSGLGGMNTRGISDWCREVDQRRAARTGAGS